MLVIKKFVKMFVPEAIIILKRTHESLKPFAQRRCNMCGFEGWFDRFGRPPRIDAKCPKCKSLERHRQLHMVLETEDLPLDVKDSNQRVLHFAAESIFQEKFRQRYKNYTTADLFQTADKTLNLEDIDEPDGSYDIVIANHVLEHVDDAKASKELCRVLAPGGIFICMVPIIEGWDSSYEMSGIDTEEGRWLHFGQYDHIRYYGKDFRQRIMEGGFSRLHEFTAEGQDVIDYGLMRGEKVFIFEKLAIS